jgi:tetratricopeptide (TPR) repeat protein
VEKEVDAVFAGLGGSDAKESLEKLETFENRNPALAHIPYFLGPKLSLLVKAGKSAEARKFAEQVVKKAREQEDPTALGAVSRALRADKEHKELQAVALEAAQAMLQVSGDKDWRALLNLAETQLALGEGEKALETARKALEVADSPAIKRYLEGRLKTFEPKKEEK